MLQPDKMQEIGNVMAKSLDMSVREMTAREWAEKIVGSDVDQLTLVISAAMARGERKGRKQMSGAAEHFETAYRYAVNAATIGQSGAADLLASAEIFAKVGYDEQRKAIDSAST